MFSFKAIDKKTHTHFCLTVLHVLVKVTALYRIIGSRALYRKMPEINTSSILYDFVTFAVSSITLAAWRVKPMAGPMQ